MFISFTCLVVPSIVSIIVWTSCNPNQARNLELRNLNARQVIVLDSRVIVAQISQRIKCFGMSLLSLGTRNHSCASVGH